MSTILDTPPAIGQAPSARQILARARRTVDHLATTTAPSSAVRVSAATAPQLVPPAVDLILAAERLDPYQRSGRTQITACVYEYLWSYWPITARPVSAQVRALATALIAGTAHTETGADDEEAAERVVVADLQGCFSPRDPRLAWQLPDGAVVLDELATNFHPTGLLDARMRRRLWADLAVGSMLAAKLGTTFAGVRVLPLRRPPSEAQLIRESTTSFAVLIVEPLDHSDLAPAADTMPAGAWR